MKYRKKPVVIEAITFDELVEHGKANCSSFSNGMPWSFKYNGHPITHENDDCYLIPTLEGTMRMGRADMLITGVNGEIYPCKAEIFAKTYDAVDETVGQVTLESRYRAALVTMVGVSSLKELQDMEVLIRCSGMPAEEKTNILAAINLLIETARKD